MLVAQKAGKKADPKAESSAVSMAGHLVLMWADD